MKVFAIPILLMVAAQADAQCVLDINGDQRTTIDELVKATTVRHVSEQSQLVAVVDRF